MKIKAAGIVTRTMKYKDTSIITDIFTDGYGLQSYIINNIRSSRSKISIGLFQPLTLLTIVAYHKDDSSLKRLSEAHCPYPFQTIHTNIRKTAIAIFLAEFLSRICRTTDPYPDLFLYIKTQLQKLDELDSRFEDFHLRFMMQLSRYLGFQPANSTELAAQIGISLSPEERSKFDGILNNKEIETLTYKERKYLLEAILDFYTLHIDGFSKMSSISILHEVLKNEK